jgi:hypothetical protein
MSPDAGFAIYVVAALSTIAANFPFLRALHDSHHDVFVSFGSPEAARFIFRGPIVMPYSNFIMWRRFSAVLTGETKARAWAEVLFVAHWLQVAGAALFFRDVYARFFNS